MYVFPCAGIHGRNYGNGVRFVSPNITPIVYIKEQFASRHFYPNCYNSADRVCERREGRILPWPAVNAWYAAVVSLSSGTLSEATLRSMLLNADCDVNITKY